MNFQEETRKGARQTRVGRLRFNKMYKLFINGKFPRSESEHSMVIENADGFPLGTVARASRKDLREAVLAARQAQPGWASRAPYNRAQILYRVAEMLEGKFDELVTELVKAGQSQKEAIREVEQSIDRLIYFCGWCDKYQAISGTINPVQSSHLCFSTTEPTGVVGVVCESKASLLGMISSIAPVIAGGNTVVLLVPEHSPFVAHTLAEALHTGDLPNGVVNLLTGAHAELLPHLAKHMDINTLLTIGTPAPVSARVREEAASGIRRVISWRNEEIDKSSFEHLKTILGFQETKTIWHPLGALNL